MASPVAPIERYTLRPTQTPSVTVPPAPDAVPIERYTIGQQPTLTAAPRGRERFARTVASALKTLLPALGTMGGGVVGGGGAAAISAGTGTPVGATVGAGLGNAAGHKAADMANAGLAKFVGVERRDDRTIPEHLKDTVNEIVQGAASEVTGRALPQLLNNLVTSKIAKRAAKEAASAQTKALPNAQQVVDAADRLGVQSAPIEMVSSRPTVRRLSQLVRESPIGGDRLTAARANLMQEVDDKAAQAVKGRIPEATGERSQTARAAQRGLQGYVERFKQARSGAEDEMMTAVRNSASQGKVTKLDGSEEALKRLEELEQQAPGVLTAETSASLSKLRNLVAAAKGEKRMVPKLVPSPTGAVDASGAPVMVEQMVEETVKEAGVPFDILMQARRALNDARSFTSGAQRAPGSEKYLADAASAIGRDIDEAAVAAGAGGALRRHNRIVRFMRDPARNIALDDIERIANEPTTDEALRYVMEGAKDGGKRLWSLRNTMRKAGKSKDWDVISANTLHEMGRPNVTATGESITDEMVPALFLKRWDALSPSAKDALTAGTRQRGLRQDYDDIATIARRLAAEGVSPQTVAKGGGVPGAALRHMILVPLLSGGGGMLASGGNVGQALGVAGMGVGTHAMVGSIGGRLFTNPKWVRVLTGVAKHNDLTPGSMPAHLGRMWAAVRGNTELEDEMQRYQDALEAQGVPVR